ncbi:MAG: acetyl esterase, partial [Planctomycetaceae bacterium]
MSYNYDPELAPLLEFLPDSALGLEDPVAARTGFSELINSMNADLDTSGIDIEETEIPGPEGAPKVRVRIYKPEGLNDTVPGMVHIHGGG